MFLGIILMCGFPEGFNKYHMEGCGAFTRMYRSETECLQDMPKGEKILQSVTPPGTYLQESKCTKITDLPIVPPNNI